MSRKIALFAALAMGLPLLSLAVLPPAGAITLPPLILPHNGSLVVDNFTGMQLNGLSAAGAGAVQLARAGRFWGPPVQATDVQDAYIHTAIGGGANDVFVMAWTVTIGEGPTSQRDIMCQLLNNRGEKPGAAIPVCTDTSDQYAPVAAMAPDGSFLVAWIDARAGGSAVYAQRFGASGGKLGSELKLTTTPEGKEAPAVTATPAGGYVLAWSDTRTGSYQIFAKVLDQNGTSVSGEVQVTLGTDHVNYATVAVDSQGRIMVAYCLYPSGSSQYDIGAQRLDPKGERLGGQMSIASGTASRTSAHVCAGPDGSFLVVWADDRNQATTGRDILGQKFDAAGSKVGGEITICDDAGDQMIPQPACDADGGIFVAWWTSEGSKYSVRAVYLSPRSIGRATTMSVSADPSRYFEAPGVAVGERGDFMVGFLEVTDTGPTTHARRGLARPYLSAHGLSGTVTTGVLPLPAGFHRWDSLSANVSFASSSADTVTFEYSVDGAQSWKALPANNSLAEAGALPLAVRARLATIDNLTTPVLHGFTLRYKYNSLPSVKLPADMTVKKNAAVTIASNVTDADLFDLIVMNYTWAQTSGKNLTLVNATGQNLSFKADKAGTFSFRLVVNDGWNDSAPATITVKVTEPKPAARSGYEWAVLVATAVVSAALLRGKRN